MADARSDNVLWEVKVEPDAQRELNWTLKTIAISFLVALLGALVSVSLRKFGEWPFPSFSEYVFAGLCGAAAAYLMKPKRPLIVFAVFVPVMSVASLLVTLLFYAYFLGATIEF
ncbi:MAG: hypothetical protein ABI039_11675 [Vicinamibacterales bacterium]